MSRPRSRSRPRARPIRRRVAAFTRLQPEVGLHTSPTAEWEGYGGCDMMGMARLGEAALYLCLV